MSSVLTIVTMNGTVENPKGGDGGMVNVAAPSSIVPMDLFLKCTITQECYGGWLYPVNVEMKVRPKTCTRTESPVAKQCT